MISHFFQKEKMCTGEVKDLGEGGRREVGEGDARKDSILEERDLR